jgi:hypothetical protein
MAPVRLILTLILSLLLSACVSTQTNSTPEAAQTSGVITEVSGTDVLELMQASGYDVVLDSDGDVRWELHQDVAWILILNEGQVLQFWSYYDGRGIGLAEVNDWNKRYYYSKTYLDDDNDVIIEIDLDLKGGTTYGAILEFIYTADLSFAVWLEELVGLGRMQAGLDRSAETRLSYAASP